MTAPGRGPGPAPLGLAILLLSALALLATSAAPPSLTDHAIGEVALGGGESAERELRVHVDPAAGAPTSGTIGVTLQSANGLRPGYGAGATVSLVAASDGEGSFDPNVPFEVERCKAGCDLTYRVRVEAAPGVLPGSIVRYEAAARLDYGYGASEPTPGGLRLALEGAVTGPVAPAWSLIAGLLALALGIALGPRADRALGTRRRRWPAKALLVVQVGLIGWMVVEGALALAREDLLGQIADAPSLLLAVADPWSVAVLGTLAWGIWLGLGRLQSDGGWLLGLAAVAATGLGGLWLAWTSTVDVVVQPVALGVVFGLFGVLGGIVIGQAWRTDPAARHDRWWAALAVLGHGVVIAGFGYLASQALYDPFSAGPTGLLLLVPAAFVALGFRRWLSGRHLLAMVADGLVAAIAALGILGWGLMTMGFPTDATRIEADDVGVAIAVVASLVAFVTACHAIPRRGGPPLGEGAEPAIPQPPAPVTWMGPSGAAPPTK